MPQGENTTNFDEQAIDSAEGYLVNGTEVINSSGEYVGPIDTPDLEFSDGEAIEDNNGNELLEFGVTASAVNHLKATNAATGGAPKLSAVGGDSSISMLLEHKGDQTAVLVFKEESDGINSAVGGVYTLSASPANDDYIGAYHFVGNNDAAEVQNFVQIEAVSTDVTDGSEEGKLLTSVLSSGSKTQVLEQSAAMTIVDANGSTPGQFGLKVRNSDGGSVGALFALEHASASPAASDAVGDIAFIGRNDAAETTFYGIIEGTIESVTDGSEAGGFKITPWIAGNPTDFIQVNPGNDGTNRFLKPIAENNTQALSGPGAVDVANAITEFTSTGTGDALTLADGVEGQHKYIVYVAEGAGADTGVLTPSNFTGGSTITFNAVGDTAHLLFTNGNWFLIGQNGVTVA